MKLETFFQKFDLFADAPDAVEKMRGLVLDLAATGCLLSRKGEWETRSMKSLATKIGSGATPAGGRESYFTEGIPLIRSMNVHFGGFDRTGLVFLSDEQAGELSNVTVQADDVLLNITGASIGRVTIAPDDMVGARVNQHVTIIRPTPELVPRFLSIFLASPSVQRMIDGIQVGATRQALTKGMIEQFEVPLPPLTEQKRIVAKVDELMALCDRLEAQQQERETRHAALARASLARFADAPAPANLNFLFHSSFSIQPSDLRKSILTLAFQGGLTKGDESKQTKADAEKVLSDAAAGRRSYWTNRHGTKRRYPEPEPFESEDLPRIRDHWLWASIDSVCAQVTDGEHIQPSYQTEGVPMLSAKHVRDGYVTFEGAGLISDEAFQKSVQRCKPENRDILIVSVGATTGRSAIVDRCPRFAIVRSVLLLKPVILQEYLLWWLKNPWAFTWMTQASGASAQPHLYIRDLKHMPVPISPLAEQRRIVAKVNQLMALVDQLETQIATSRATGEDLIHAVVSELTQSTRSTSSSFRIQPSSFPIVLVAEHPTA